MPYITKEIKVPAKFSYIISYDLPYPEYRTKNSKGQVIEHVDKKARTFYGLANSWIQNLFREHSRTMKVNQSVYLVGSAVAKEFRDLMQKLPVLLKDHLENQKFRYSKRKGKLYRKYCRLLIYYESKELNSNYTIARLHRG